MEIYIYHIISIFLHKSLPVVDNKPDYQIIHDIRIIMYGNAYIVTTILDGGNHVHIVIVMRYMLYDTI